MNIDESEKFDAIIIDEGQDFEENWIICIESMLKKQGEFYIFADTHQNLFNKDIDIINKMVVSKHKLTRNSLLWLKVSIAIHIPRTALLHLL